MSKIFISYRRDDSAAMCGHIYEKLAAHFGRDAIFKDVDDIPYGVRFPDYLAEQVSACRIMLVVIGRFWLTLTTPDGTRRLDASGDFVRTEVEMGLRNGLIVVPVLVDNASMPHSEDLPASIRELVEYHGAQVRYDPDFDVDMQRLIRQLERWLGVTPPAPPAAPADASGGQPPVPVSPPRPASSPDPQAALLARQLPAIREAFAAHEWYLVIDSASYLLERVPEERVPPDIERMLGEAAYELERYTLARRSLDNAIRRGDTDTGTLALAARVCMKLNDASAAARYLKDALGVTIDPALRAERLSLLRDYTAALTALKQWDELLLRAEEGGRLASDDAVWPRLRLAALTELNRGEDALAAARTVTARPDATASDWLARARLARAVEGETEAANAEVRAALDAAARLAGPNDDPVAAARRELFPPPLAPERFPERLGSLGYVAQRGNDPRTGKAVPFILPPTVPVPAGPFQMGQTNPRDPDSRYDGPARTATTGAFAIARYPVTVAEYACFVDAGQTQPRSWQDQLTKLEHPVVQVTWHDATAYAEWLAGLTGQPWRLPAEEEWEKAARWDPRSGKSLVYPWGDTFDAARCNTSESAIGTTTPVGRYGPAGASPCGAEDMAGNVWEWTASTRDSATQNRVLRGGSWNFDHRLARAACRNHFRPVGFLDLGGFRLVVAPVRAGS
jgi:formylglycine-generating enzyme required for sulfatase activity